MSEPLVVRKRYSKSELRALIGANLEFDKNLGQFTSFKTGGDARYFLRASSEEELVRAVRASRAMQLACFVMGGGSNLLISDEGYDGLVVRVDVRDMRLIGDHEIECGAGESLQDLVDFATDNSLTGLEFASGIWGTVGGAIYGNAGAFGGEIGSRVTRVLLVDRQGDVKTVDREYCRFAYRDSHLKRTGEVVVKACFQLAPGDAEQIRTRSDKILKMRQSKHPVKGCSAGCFFKNIPDPKEPYGKIPAGRLLDEAGVKQLAVGGARVFDKHANIIVNTGTATSSDIRRLANLMKRRVFDKFGITLQEEVIQLGTFQPEENAY